MTSLFVIAKEYREAAEKLAELDLDAQTIADTLESLSGDLGAKAQNVAYVIRNLETSADAIKAFEEQQKERRLSIERRVEGLKQYLASSMQACGIEKISGPGVEIWFRNSSAVVITGEDLIPSEYMRTKPAPPPEPDKKLIGDAIKAGTEIPGAHIEKRKTIQIK